MKKLALALNCKGSSLRSLRELEEYQGDLKSLSEPEYKKLRSSMLKYGFVAPLFVWGNKILDGHQRLRTVVKMLEEGELEPVEALPVVEVKAKSEKEARELVLVFSSAYGRMSEDSLYEYLKLNELDFGDLNTVLDLPTIDLERFADGYLRDSGSDEEGGDGGEKASEEPSGKLGRIKRYCTKLLAVSDDDILRKTLEDIIGIIEGKK